MTKIVNTRPEVENEEGTDEPTYKLDTTVQCEIVSDSEDELTDAQESDFRKEVSNHEFKKLKSSNLPFVDTWNKIHADEKELNTRFYYAFTVTPRGKRQRLQDYKEEFINDLKKVKVFKNGYFYSEVDTTQHLHGLVLSKDKSKFTNCLGREKYVCLIQPVYDKYAWLRYITKHPIKYNKNKNTAIFF